MTSQWSSDTKKERKKTDNANEGWEEDRIPTCTGRILKGRKKTDKANEGWEEDRVPTCTSGILEGRSGTQGNEFCVVRSMWAKFFARAS